MRRSPSHVRRGLATTAADLAREHDEYVKSNTLLKRELHECFESNSRLMQSLYERTGKSCMLEMRLSDLSRDVIELEGAINDRHAHKRIERELVSLLQQFGSELEAMASFALQSRSGGVEGAFESDYVLRI
jgi:uncharacterized coiled-coil DUF342 family protein